MSEMSFEELMAFANEERARMDAADSLRLTWEAQQAEADAIVEAALQEDG